QGPIAVDLKNLPKGVSATKATLASGQDQAELELKADFGAAEGDHVEVQARGNATLAGKLVSSPCITLNVASLGKTPGLDLKVAPGAVQLSAGAKTTLKVTLVRKGYDGPLVLEMRNLPADVEATPVKLAAGEKNAEITLRAKLDADTISRGDVVVIGIASAADNHVFASPHLTVNV